MSDIPPANDKKIRDHEHFGKLFDATPIPDHLDGFEQTNAEDVRKSWPEGTDDAKEVSCCAPPSADAAAVESFPPHQSPQTAAAAGFTIVGRRGEG